MIFAPLSEIPQIGRNPIYIGTLIIFVCFQLAVIYAKNFGMLLAFRFLTGVSKCITSLTSSLLSTKAMQSRSLADQGNSSSALLFLLQEVLLLVTSGARRREHML